MFSRCKLLGLLTQYQAELLKTLYELKATSPEASWRPRELGAFKGSHHHQTLAALEGLGYVERLEVSRRLRPQYAYRITDAGTHVWENFVQLSQVTLLAVPGRSPDRRRAEMAMALTGT